MATMRAAQATAPGKLELVERDIPEPTAGTVRIKVTACGICHSDAMTIEGAPGIEYPRIPGHEVAGVIDAVASDVTQWKVGDVVGVGWNGGYCGKCEPCRRGNLFACVTHQATGVTYDGGYAEYLVAPASAVARMPDDLDPVAAAPLMCAGVTTFNALRNSGARPGDVVAVQGVGGLGHLGIQYAKRMGYHTVAINRGTDKEKLAKELGADVYIDSTATDAADALQQMGGAAAILSTVTTGDAMSAMVGGLGIGGKLLVIGVGGALQVPPLPLIMGNRSVAGWYSGTAIDSEDTLQFSSRCGISSMNEIMPFSKAPEAYAYMLTGKARFRIVMTMHD
ncbi:alcohol dehydrogenase [Aeoliella sp. SH292]|uniref:alcohol dehydrogenase n=1 Tax=Aeoliella sp. SH292 TaxID=3454464 RepID=UPI003F9AA121